MSTLFLNREQIAEFSRCGFLVLRSLVDEDLVKELLEEISANLEPLREPIEFEADVGYPGAPARRESKGGRRRAACFRRSLSIRDLRKNFRIA